MAGSIADDTYLDKFPMEFMYNDLGILDEALLIDMFLISEHMHPFLSQRKWGGTPL
jgi:hypothetical protein